MLKKLQYQLFLTLGFWLSAMVSGIAQTYPVTISTQISQPSPIYLSSYADATTINSPIKVQISLNDLTISNRQIRLKCYFQGQSISLMTNDFVVGARNLYLEGGVPLQLTNVDLAPYFEYQNLLGINPNQYAQALPEGIYNFSVEVYDFATNKKLSKKTSVTTIIFQNDPPFLNLPLNNASIMQQNIQNIIFSWTPRQINVSNVEYEFSLVEIWDKYTPVQNAFLYSPPLFTTTTRATTLQYSVSEPQLLPGKKYAWRVKAKALQGAEEIGVFKNNGYSEIFSFDYETYCTAPLAITTTDISQDQAKITWSGDIDNFDYQVNYREKNADSDWYKIVTPREFATISNLKPNATYEYTVGASCEVGKYTHSTIHEFTTMAKDEIAFVGCGIKPDPADLANKNPLPELFANDVVKAGDFPIVVLHATGSNGKFSGDGYVTLPFLEKFRTLIDAANAAGGPDIGKYSRIRITFENIGVNTDFKLISGEIIASYDPNWKGMADGDQILTDILGSDGKPIEGKLDYVVKSATLNPDGSTTITGENGAVTTLPKSAYDQVYTDKNGTTVTIPANGSAPPTIGAAAPGGKATASNTNGMSSNGEVSQISSPDVRITFEDSKDSKYAFDPQPENGSAKLKSSYEVIPTGDGKVYKVNYKAVSDLNGDDYVIAKAEFSKGKKSSDIVFKTIAGAKVDAEWTSDNTAKIALKKTLNFGKDGIIATVKGTPVKSAQDTTKTVEGKYDIAGKLNVWHLTKKSPISVTLLSVNGASTPSVGDAEKFLNGVYNKAGITFTVTTQNVKVNDLPAEIECGNSDLLNVYTDGQIDIISQIESNPDFKYNEKTYYVLYTGKSGQDGYDGFMPLGGQYAFVFNSGNLKTAAHELGHGIFGLKHPFSTKEESGKTNLLMDYGNGTVLSHNDWDIIHSGGWKFYGFQKSSSGALAGGYGLTPDWKFVRTNESTILSGSTVPVVPEGMLGGFESNENGKIVNYIWNITSQTYKIDGTGTDYPQTNYRDKIEEKNEKTTVIWLIYKNNEECSKRKYIRTYYDQIKTALAEKDLAEYIAKIDPIVKKDKLEIYSNTLGCTGNNTSGNGTGSENYSNYVANLAKDANKKYTEDKTAVNTSDVHLFDLATVISDKEKQKILNQLGGIKQSTGILTKIYLVDAKTPSDKKTEINNYLNSLKGKEIGLLVDFTKADNPAIKTFLGDGIEGKGTPQMDKYLQVLLEVLPQFDGKYTPFNPFTAMLDGLAELIGKAAIPERFYNPDAENYNSYPALVYSYLNLSIVQDKLNETLGNPVYNQIYSKSRSDFAFTCGIWNGLVGTIEAVPAGISMILKIHDSVISVIVNYDGARDKLIKTIYNLNWVQIKSIYSTIGGEIGKGWDKYTKNQCMISYSSGQAGFVVLTFFIGVGEANAAKTFLQALEKIDLAGQLIGRVFKIGGKLIKPLVDKSSKAIKFVLAETAQFAERIEFRLPRNTMFCGIPYIEIKLRERLKKLTAEEIEKIEKDIIEQLDDPNIPVDENGNKLVNLVIDGENTPALIGTEESLAKVGRLNKVVTRTLDAVTDSKIIDRVKTLRQKLTSRYKTSGNFAWAEAEVTGLTKTEYYAHSRIDELSRTLPERVPDISLKPATEKEIFPWTPEPNNLGDMVDRNGDTEYKILTEIAEKLGNNTNATGKITLFTERVPCKSCSNVIDLFSAKYQKIELEIIHNSDNMLIDF